MRNPADGRVVGTVPIEMPDAVAAKAGELRLFQPEWEGLGPRGRKRWLLKYQDWVLGQLRAHRRPGAVRERQDAVGGQP